MQTALMFPRLNLTLEQNMALDVLEKHLPNLTAKDIQPFDLSSIAEEGNHLFVEGNITTSQIPREKHWKWNQSRAKYETMDYTRSYHLSFFKLNTRKASKTSKHVPQYKIWIFNLTNFVYNTKASFSWCEKGNIRSSLDSTFLQELAFLQKFISRECAHELGWCKNEETKPQCNTTEPSPFPL